MFLIERRWESYHLKERARRDTADTSAAIPDDQALTGLRLS